LKSLKYPEAMSQQILVPTHPDRIDPLLGHHVAGLGATQADWQDATRRVIDNLINIRDVDGSFLLRLDDGRVLDTKSWYGWEWTQGIGLYGLWKVWQMTGDGGTWSHMTEWFKARFAEGAPSRNINTVAPLLTLAHLYERTGEVSYRPWLETWGQWVYDGLSRTVEGGFQHIVYNSVNHQQLWDDTLMMSVLPLAKIGLVLNRPHYVEEAKRQFMLHAKYLTDVQTGLWFHGWTFEGRHHFARARWARGNSWVTIVIPEFLELLDLPATDGLRMFLTETLKAQVDALIPLQTESGMWRTLLDDPTSYEEAAATAGFAYGILKGVRLGLLPKDYELVGRKAALAVRRHINAAGELTQVSFGTPVFNTLQEYKDIPLTSMPFGQSMALLALVEFSYRFL
jgi:unsaturated rhamnogalacturonyl hydrolase